LKRRFSASFCVLIGISAIQRSRTFCFGKRPGIKAMEQWSTRGGTLIEARHAVVWVNEREPRGEALGRWLGCF
jgi:hypothetical protein